MSTWMQLVFVCSTGGSNLIDSPLAEQT